MLGIGLQNKNLDDLSTEFKMPASQVLAKFYDAIKKLTKNILQIMERTIESQMDDAQPASSKEFKPLEQTMEDELDEAAKILEKKQKKELLKLKKESMNQYAIKGTDQDWGKALSQPGKKTTLISVKSGEKRSAETLDEQNNEDDKDKGVDWNKNKKKRFQNSNKKGRKDKFFK